MLCRRENTKYSRMNLLGWSILCPAAAELNWSGTIPFEQPIYPTADELKRLHGNIVERVESSIQRIIPENSKIISLMKEKQVKLSFTDHKSGDQLCGIGKIDLALVLKHGNHEVIIYFEVSSTRIHVAKPWQALLKSIALYHEYRLPIITVIVSIEKIKYKLLSSRDYYTIINKIYSKPKEDFSPNPNMCSLCELVHYCPHRGI